jgi:lipopolysaccharide biosynthesis glycosyltransferase
MSNDKTAVCIGVTSDLAFAACVTFINFSQHHNHEKFVFFLFSDKKLDNFAQPLRDMGLEVRTVKYRAPLSWLQLWRSRAIGYFSPLVLSKFEALRLLSDHQGVLWLDYDILIQKPLDEILQAGEFDMSFVLSPGAVSDAFPRLEELRISQFGQSRGMSAGFLSLRNSFPNHQEAPDKLYELFNKFSKHLYLPEQGVFDLFFTNSHARIEHLDYSKYCSPVENEFSSTSSIIHTAGPNKFWNSTDNDEWSANYIKWKNAGGGGYHPLYSRIKRTARKMKYVLAICLDFILASRPWGPESVDATVLPYKKN